MHGFKATRHFIEGDGASVMKNSLRRDVQGLRAIAVILVVAFHSGLPVPGGFVGVDVFFVISGYVIAAMLQREFASTGRLDLRRFYMRRFQRLTPALALVALVTVSVSSFVLSPFGEQQNTAKAAIGGILLIANAVIARTTGGYFDAPAEHNPLLNIWSLSVEEQFYIIFPSIIALGWLLDRRSRYSAIILVSVIAVVSFVFAVLGSIVFPNPLIGFYSPIVRSWEFAAGALLALSISKPDEISIPLATAAGLSGAILLIASVLVISSSTPFPSVWTLLPVVGTTLLITSGFNASRPLYRMLATRAMVKIGDWSYSIYLWHWPFIVFARQLWPNKPWVILAASALSIIPAVASYTWVEQPIRNYRPPSRLKFAALVAVTILPPLVFSAISWQAARTLFWLEPASAIADLMTMPTGWGNPRCISTIPVNRRDIEQCQWHKAAHGAPIYLVGDSNAMHFSEAVKSAGASLGRPTTALGNDGCPLIDVLLSLNHDPNFAKRCRDDYVALMDWLTASPPGVVMIGSIDRYWWSDNYLVRNPDRPNETASNAMLLNEGLKRTVERLQRAGHAVALMQTVPHYLIEPYVAATLHCIGWTAIQRTCDPVSKMSLSAANELQKASREGIEVVAAETSAAVVDFRNYFCAGGQCSTRINGRDMYMPDGYHLNRVGSGELSDSFVSAIKSIGRQPHDRFQQ